ncbi:MAG TPA: M48 family metalloprotease [Sporichthyaceae bacterium]|nr:M48 family metalloprotease [Sporichthyaceae bacterium]
MLVAVPRGCSSQSFAAAATFALLGVALVVLVVGITPWRTLPAPPGGPVPVDIHRDFTAAQMAREVAYHRQLWPAVLGGTAAELLAALVLGFTPAGARLICAVARPFGGRRWVRFILGTVAVTGVGRLAVLPFDVWRVHLQRAQGLVVESWTGYAVDFAIESGFQLLATGVGLGVLYGLMRSVRHWWWAPGAAIAAALVAVTSFVYPIVVEPAFTHLEPMPAGPLRDSLLALARQDGVHISGVEIADESARTTAVNAYVSGIGSSRRIVIFDTTLRRLSPAQVRSIVAHELGHAKQSDVAWGTGEAALGAAAAVCLLYLALGSRWLLRRAGVSDPRDPQSVALVLALVAAAGAVTLPPTLLVSRRIEARADIHALNLTRDPATLISLQQLIAVRNLADLNPPWPAVLFHADHPTGPQRIADARTWAVLHGVPDTAPGNG